MYTIAYYHLRDRFTIQIWGKLIFNRDTVLDHVSKITKLKHAFSIQISYKNASKLMKYLKCQLVLFLAVTFNIS